MHGSHYSLDIHHRDSPFARVKLDCMRETAEWRARQIAESLKATHGKEGWSFSFVRVDEPVVTSLPLFPIPRRRGDLPTGTG